MPHNPRHGADPGVIIGGGSSSTSSPPSQPSSPQDYFGSMFTAPGSSTANVTGTSEEADKGTSGPGIFGFSGGSGGGSGGGSSGGQGTDTSGSGQGTDTSGSGQGTDSSDTSDEGEGIDDIFFKIFTGPEIEQLSPDRLKRAKSVLSQYISLGETNPLKLRALMTGNILGGIFGKDQTVSDMEGKIVKPEDAFNSDGTLKEGLRYTKEGIIKLLDEDQEGGNILESLKKFNPELYYPFMGMPATSGSLVDLANIPVTPEMQGNNPEFAKMIFDARMELDRMGKNPMTGESQSGIMTASSAPPVPPPVIPPEMKEDPVPENPILNPIMSQRDPFNLAKFYAGLPQYTQQGVMSPSLMQYYRNLGLFPRA